MDRRHRHLLAALALILLALAYGWGPWPAAPAPDARAEPVGDLSVIPRETGGWKGRDMMVDESAFTILTRDADAWLVREYAGKGKELVWLSLVTTRDQRKLFRVHIPEICYPAQGWTILDRSASELRVDGHGTIRAIKLVAHKGSVRTLVLYWFTSNRRYVSNTFLHRLLLVWDGIVGQMTPGTLIQISSPMADGGEDSTMRTGARFMSVFYPHIREAIHGVRTSAKVTPEAGGTASRERPERAWEGERRSER